MPKWREYQTETEEFFRSLGFVATVESPVPGIRSKHRIDVWVEGDIQGIHFKWVVECKCWKTNVPKEKVMALMSIVQDLGADRGFLLSEVGFQSGAIHAAEHTNITLTSLADLRSELDNRPWETAGMNIRWRLLRLRRRLRGLHKQANARYSPFMDIMGRISFVDMALNDAYKWDFPTIYAAEGEHVRFVAENWDDLTEKAAEVLKKAEEDAEAAEKSLTGKVGFETSAVRKI